MLLRSLALALLSIAVTAGPSRAAAACTVKLTGAAQQVFPCKAELRKVDGGWHLLLMGSPSLPWDFSLSATFRVRPDPRTYATKDLKDMQAMARDKHAGGANWGARFATELPRWGPNKLPTPEGTASISIAEIGGEPDVHGTARATLEPQSFNKDAAKAKLELAFEF